MPVVRRTPAWPGLAYRYKFSCELSQDELGSRMPSALDTECFDDSKKNSVLASSISGNPLRTGDLVLRPQSPLCVSSRRNNPRTAVGAADHFLQACGWTSQPGLEVRVQGTRAEELHRAADVRDGRADWLRHIWHGLEGEAHPEAYPKLSACSSESRLHADTSKPWKRHSA